MSKFNCIILDPDMPSRMKLKQVTTQVVDFGITVQAGSVHDANQLLTSNERSYDIIFVSARLENNVIADFIAQSKKIKSAEDAAFVLIMKALPQGGASVAQNMLIGGDSVLCEPYSVDSLVEITRLATRVKRERSDAREKIAITLLVGDLINQVDLIACLRASGCEPGTSIRTLRDMCGFLKNLTPEMLAYYYEAAAAKFEEAKVPPKALATKKYGGVSARVKKKLENKIISEAKTEKPSA